MHIAHMYNVDCEEKKAKMNVCTSATCFKPLAKWWKYCQNSLVQNAFYV